jgi:hypothetical protein
MKIVLSTLVGVVAACSSAFAQDSEICGVSSPLAGTEFRLPRVAKAIAGKKLVITVFGSGSSSLAGPAGTKIGYPGKLEAALVSKLPGVAVSVTVHAKMRDTAEMMRAQFAQVLKTDAPALVIWQTGTVEAVRQLSLDDFEKTLDKGLETIIAGHSDAILMNMQYSPRTEVMIAVTPYAEAMRFAALRHEVPLFDRLAIMRHWGELGTFDLADSTKKTDVAAQVHDCIGRLLAGQIIAAANLPRSESRGNQ